MPLCDLNYETMKASNYPQCPHCKGTARPHILMFGDGDYSGHEEQDEQFNTFLQEPVDVALLIGSSGTVPTNDYIAYGLINRGTKIITINPDPSANRIAQTEWFLSLKSREALIQLDEELKNL